MISSTEFKIGDRLIRICAREARSVGPALNFSVILNAFSMPDRAYLNSIDPELVPGAHNAIDVCLRLKQDERVTIITDEATADIAAALQSGSRARRLDYSLFVLEHHARVGRSQHAGNHSR